MDEKEQIIKAILKRLERAELDKLRAVYAFVMRYLRG